MNLNLKEVHFKKNFHNPVYHHRHRSIGGHAWVRRPRCGATTQSRHRHNIYYCMSGSPDTNTSSAADFAIALSKIVSDNIESGDVFDRT